jgi:hypothetical protein
MWNQTEVMSLVTSYQVLGKVFRALREDGVPRSSVARGLHITVEEFESLVFGLVMASVPGGRRGNSKPTSSHSPNLRVV